MEQQWQTDMLQAWKDNELEVDFSGRWTSWSSWSDGDNLPPGFKTLDNQPQKHYRRRPKQDAPWLPPQQDGFGPWIEHAGGSSPLHPNTLCMVLSDRECDRKKFDTECGPDTAGYFVWDCAAGSGIVAYCVKLEPAQVQGETVQRKPDEAFIFEGRRFFLGDQLMLKQGEWRNVVVIDVAMAGYVGVKYVNERAGTNINHKAINERWVRRGWVSAVDANEPMKERDALEKAITTPAKDEGWREYDPKYPPIQPYPMEFKMVGEDEKKRHYYRRTDTPDIELPTWLCVAPFGQRVGGGRWGL